ncbi:MAG: choice-of-anchor D domain-containing protein, partial [Terriglobales bacterium]
TGTAPLTNFVIAATPNYTQTNTCGASVAPNANCQISVVFTPSTMGALNGTLTITDTAPGSPQTVTLTGTGVEALATLSPTSLTFTAQQVETTGSPQVITLTNAGNIALSIKSILASANYGATNNCNGSVAPNGSCQISVTFTPATLGALNGTLTLTDNAGTGTQAVALTGTGLEAEANLSPSALSFSAELVGVASTAQKVTVKNPGNEALSFKSIAASGDFAETNTCGTSVAANGSCAISVTFTATAGGTRSGTLTLTDNATGNAQTVSLTGTGQDFSFAPPSGGTTTASVSPGQPATYTLSLAGLGGLDQSVAFTCTGAPSESRCSVSPSTLMPGSSATSVTVTVTTTAASLVTPLLRIALPPAGGTSQGPKGLWWLLAAGLMGLLAWRLRVLGEPVATVNRFLSDRRLVLRRRPHRQQGAVRSYRLAPALAPPLAGLALVVVMALGMAGCGGGGGSGPAPNLGTPAGTYTLTVTATANTTPKPLSHDVTLTMKVQ